MDLQSLREHIIHLAARCDDMGVLIRAVQLLETGELQRQPSFCPGFDEADASVSESTFRRATTQFDCSVEDPLDVCKARPSQMLFAPMDFDFGLGADPMVPQLKPGEEGVDGAPVATTNDASGHESNSASNEAPAHTSPSRSMRRRIAISAMPMNMESVAQYVPRVIPKSAEEAAVVRSGVSESHLFTSMDDEEREVIVKAMEKKVFESGHAILEEGEPPSGYFYMIVSGTCEVTKQGKYVATLTPGSTFGELEMMYNIPKCSASITSVTACTMWCLDQESYQNIVLKVTISKRERFQEALARVSFLESVSDYDKMTLADALFVQHFEPGAHLIRFAEKGKFMHIILEGGVQVVGRDKGRKVEVVRLGKGDVVGELEFLFGHPTVADVVAIDKVKTASIAKDHFERCMGPVLDELKRFVAEKGNYQHYLSASADDDVKRQIRMLGRRVRRTADGATEATLTNLDEGGEVVLVDRHAEVAHHHHHHTRAAISQQLPTVFRYPLAPLQDSSSLLLVGLRENGTIVSWNEAMEKVTNYRASDAVGRSFYSFLLSEGDQRKLHEAVQNAIKYAGNAEGFRTEAEGKEKAIFAFQRSDGLTRSQLQFTIVPPTVAHKDVSEMLLAVGVEVRRPPPQRTTDATKWFLENIKKDLRECGSNDECREKIRAIVSQFEARSDGLSDQSAENLRVVNIRQLIGQLLMDYSTVVIENGHSVTQSFEECYVDEVYCDSKLLPECLRYALSNCVNHLRHANIRIGVSVVEACGEELLQIQFADNGPGIPTKVLAIFNDRSSERDIPMTRVRKAVESQGGTMTVVVGGGSGGGANATEQGGTTVTFRIPFIPHEELQSSMYGPGLSESGNAGNVGSASSASFIRRQQTFTSLVIEESAVHRNMMCALLWERKHAVLPGYSLADVQRLRDAADIVIVDPQQSVLAHASLEQPDFDPYSFLRSLTKSVTVIITCEGFTDSTRDAYHAAGFITLNKPCTAMQAMTALRKAEELSAKMKANQRAVDALRQTFNEDQNRGEWKKGKLLGKGAFGEVYEATDVLTNGKMAVKVMRVSESANKQEVIHEIEVMRTLHHPNIIHYLYAQDNTDDNTITVFMEYAAGGTLQGYLQSRETLDHSEFVRLLREIVDGVAYTHEMRFVHCDLKTANVFLTADGRCKIGDFGTAKQLLEDSDEIFIMSGTPMYMSPECLAADVDEKQGYSFPADIWSLGVIALEMATNRPPFSHIKEIQGAMGLMRYVSELQDVPDLSPLFEKAPAVIEFVSACLQPDPAKRPRAAELKDFSIFAEEGGDGNMKNALKAMKRAQLLHVLNQFVAFQEPEEIEELRREREQYRTHRSDSGFFDTSSDDSEHDGTDDQDAADDEGGAAGNAAPAPAEGLRPAPKKRNANKHKRNGFFDTSSDDEDSNENDGGHKQAQKEADNVGGGPDVVHDPAETSKGKPEGKVAAASPRDDARTNEAANSGVPLPLGRADNLTDSQECNGHHPCKQPPQLGSPPTSSEPHPVPLAPHPPEGGRQRHSSGSATNGRPSPLHGRAASPPVRPLSPKGGLSVEEIGAVHLHEAVLALLDALQLPVADDRNGLVQQYREMLSAVTSGCCTNTADISGNKPVSNVEDAEQRRINFARLISSDVELLNDLSKDLRACAHAA